MFDRLWKIEIKTQDLWIKHENLVGKWRLICTSPSIIRRVSCQLAHFPEPLFNLAEIYLYIHHEPLTKPLILKIDKLECSLLITLHENIGLFWILKTTYADYPPIFAHCALNSLQHRYIVFLRQVAKQISCHWLFWKQDEVSSLYQTSPSKAFCDIACSPRCT